jgi:DNA-binding NarL/FixJ family response regulator
MTLNRLECARMCTGRLCHLETIMFIRLVLADEHRLLLDGLECLLRREPDFEVVACCHNGVQALHAVRQLRPDILILDFCMPGKPGLEILRELHQAALPTRVVPLWMRTISSKPCGWAWGAWC